MLYFVPTPIGNLEDITMRALKVLESVKIVFCEDTRVTKKLLSLLSQRFKIQFGEKIFYSFHSHNEKEFLSKLDISIFENDIAYLSDAGMPTISDPGCALVKFCVKHGIKYEVLPGANALLLGYASSGFCDTQFLFFGFLPHKGKEREEALKKALFSGYITILYESPHRLEKLLKEIEKFSPERKIFLLKEATKLYEEKFFGTAGEILKNLKNKAIKGEWVVVLQKSEEILKSSITKEDILKLNIPKKEAAKLLSKISDLTPKECYNLILKEKC